MSAMTRLAVPAVLAALAVLPVQAAPPPPGSDQAEMMAPHGDWIRRQRSSTGVNCCDWSDGRVVQPHQVRRRPDGVWEVFYARDVWDDGTDVWLVVPASAVLPTLSPVGLPVAWILRSRVLCLALGGMF